MCECDSCKRCRLRMYGAVAPVQKTHTRGRPDHKAHFPQIKIGSQLQIALRPGAGIVCEAVRMIWRPVFSEKCGLRHSVSCGFATPLTAQLRPPHPLYTETPRRGRPDRAQWSTRSWQQQNMRHSLNLEVEVHGCDIARNSVLRVAHASRNYGTLGL